MMKKKSRRRSGESDLHHQERRENLAETDRGEPHLVGPEHGEITQRQEPDEDDDESEADPESSRESTKSSRPWRDISRTTHATSLGRFSNRNNGAGATGVQRWEGRAAREALTGEPPSRRRVHRARVTRRVTRRDEEPYVATLRGVHHTDLKGSSRGVGTETFDARPAPLLVGAFARSDPSPLPSVRILFRRANTIVTARSAAQSFSAALSTAPR